MATWGRAQAGGHGGGGTCIQFPMLPLATGNGFGLMLQRLLLQLMLLLLLLLFAPILALFTSLVRLLLASVLDVSLGSLLHRLGCLCRILPGPILLATIGRRSLLGGRLLPQLLAPLRLGTKFSQCSRSGATALLAIVSVLLLVLLALGLLLLVGLATTWSTTITATVTATTIATTITVTATAKATANMAALALTTVTNTTQAADRRHRNVTATAIATTFTTATTVAADAAAAAICVAAAMWRPLESGHIDQLDQRLARITELPHAVLDAIGPKILGDQLLDPLLRHRLRDGIRVGAQLAQRSAGRDLGTPGLATAIQGQVEDPPRLRVVRGGVSVVVLKTHVLVEDAVVGEVFLQQPRAMIK